MATDYDELRKQRLVALSPERRAPYESIMPTLRSLGFDGMRARGSSLRPAPAKDPQVTWHDVVIEGPNGLVPTRVCTPKAGGTKGIDIDLLHGGYIYAGEWDILRDENRAYADRLRDAGDWRQG